MAEGENVRRDKDLITKLLGEQIDRADRYKRESTRLQNLMNQLCDEHKREVLNKNLEIKQLKSLLEEFVERWDRYDLLAREVWLKKAQAALR